MVHGKLQAALKLPDGSHVAPTPRSHLWLLHVAVADESDVGPACGYPTFLDELTIDAARAQARCRRPGCRELFARADDVAAGRAPDATHTVGHTRPAREELDAASRRS